MRGFLKACRHGGKSLVAAAGLLLLGLAAASGQTVPVSDAPAAAHPNIELIKKVDSSNNLFTFDYGIPASPALMLAGISPDKIKPATSLKPFVLSLPGLIDGSSGVTSAALDTSILWALGEDPGVFDYADGGNYFQRVLTRSRFGIALTKGDDGGGDAAKQKPSRIAFGLSFTLGDGTDPLMAGGPGVFALDGYKSVWRGCVEDNVSLLKFVRDIAKEDLFAIFDFDPSNLRPDQVDALRKILAAADQRENVGVEDRSAHLAVFDSGDATKRTALFGNLKSRLDAETLPERDRLDVSSLDALKACKEAASAAAEHGNDLQLGLGGVWNGTAGKWADFQDPNFGIWLSGRLSLDDLLLNRDASGHGLSELDAAKDNFKTIGKHCTEDDDRAIGDRLLSCWSIGGSGRYSIGEVVATGNAGHPMFKANTLEGWIGLERTTDRFKFGGYVGYLNQAAADAAEKPFAKSGTRWLVTGAVSLDALLGEVMPGAWLVGSYGAARGSVTTLDDKVAMLTLTFGPPKVGSELQGGSGEK